MEQEDIVTWEDQEEVVSQVEELEAAILEDQVGDIRAALDQLVDLQEHQEGFLVDMVLVVVPEALQEDEIQGFTEDMGLEEDLVMEADSIHLDHLATHGI